MSDVDRNHVRTALRLVCNPHQDWKFDEYDDINDYIISLHAEARHLRHDLVGMTDRMDAWSGTAADLETENERLAATVENLDADNREGHVVQAAIAQTCREYLKQLGNDRVMYAALEAENERLATMLETLDNTYMSYRYNTDLQIENLKAYADSMATAWQNGNADTILYAAEIGRLKTALGNEVEMCRAMNCWTSCDSCKDAPCELVQALDE